MATTMHLLGEMELTSDARFPVTSFLTADVEGGLADAPREAGFDVPAAAALDTGFTGADFEPVMALDAGLACNDTYQHSKNRQPATVPIGISSGLTGCTFFDGGFFASSSGTSTSSVVRFSPREDLGLGAAGSSSAGSSSAAGATLAVIFLALGLGTALLG